MPPDFEYDQWTAIYWGPQACFSADGNSKPFSGSKQPVSVPHLPVDAGIQPPDRTAGRMVTKSDESYF